MFNRKSLATYGITITLFVLSLALAIPVSACSPAPDQIGRTIQERIDNAPLVLVGTVVNGTTSWGTTIAIAEVEVETYLKGEGLAIVNIAGFGAGPDCLSPVQIGQRYIFFAEGNTGETLNAVYLGVNDAVATADAQTVAEVSAYTGQSNVPIPLPFDMQVQRWSQKYAPYGIGILVMLGVIGAAFVVKRRLSDGRKPKAKRGEF